jgi:hypothetical protein
LRESFGAGTIFGVRLVFAGLASLWLGTSACQGGGDCGSGCKPAKQGGVDAHSLTFTASIDGAPVDGCDGGVDDWIFPSSDKTTSIFDVGCSNALWSLDLRALGPELSTIGTGPVPLHDVTYTLSYLGKGPSCSLPNPSLLEVAVTGATGADPSQFQRTGTVHVTAGASPTPGDGGVCPKTSLDVTFEFTLSASDLLSLQVCDLGC